MRLLFRRGWIAPRLLTAATDVILEIVERDALANRIRSLRVEMQRVVIHRTAGANADVVVVRAQCYPFGLELRITADVRGNEIPRRRRRIGELEVRLQRLPSLTLLHTVERTAQQQLGGMTRQRDGRRGRRIGRGGLELNRALSRMKRALDCGLRQFV